MDLIKVKVEKAGVTMEGADVPVGTILELDEKSANSLIDSGHASDPAAEEAAEKEAAEKAAAEKEAAEKAAAKTSQNGPGSTEGDGQVQTPSADVENAAAEELAKITKALDDKYNRDPLAEEAKNVGVEFAFNAKKAAIIQAVIDQGKAQALLDR